MSTLHIVSSSPFSSDSLQRCLSLLSDGDTVLFIENGTYISNCAELLPPELPCFVLKEDLLARGLSTTTLQAVDYSDFVRLVCEHNNSVNWA